MSARVKELTDWMSPVLVKEMRQGLKGKAFVGAFLLLHACMFMGMATALLQPTPRSMREMSTGLFWMVTVVSLVAFIPGLGMNALTAEIKDKTFELMILTKLSAWRIVVGKWASIVAQASLLVSSLLPYLVVRYFLGGVDVLQELLVLLGLTTVSMFLVGLSIFGSTFKSQLVRLLMLGVLGGALMTGVGMGASIGRGGAGHLPGSSGAMQALGLVVGLASSILLLIFMLQAAATRVGPLAENHAAPKRGVGLVLLALAALPLPQEFRMGLAVLLVPVLALISLDACGERRSNVPSTYLPYAKWPRGLRVFAYLLYPGWPSGVLFTAVASLGLGVLLGAALDIEVAPTIVCSLAFFAAVMVPVALTVAARKSEFVGLAAVALHLFMVLAALVLSELSDLLGSGLQSDTMAALFPLTAVAVSVGSDGPDLAVTSVLGMLGWLALVGLLIAWRGRRDVQQMSETIQRAAAS